ncbi:MAG: RHS repeat-associated core domain-containing protein [Anaerolineae bacterium]
MSSYDSAGRQISKTDGNGWTTKTCYTAHGKPAKIEHPDETCETFCYYPNGELKSSTNQEGTITSFTYDIFNRVLSKTLTSSKGEILFQEIFRYNNFHLLSHTEIDPTCSKERTTEYEYDFAGRKINESMRIEGGLERTIYSYDSLGRLQTTQTEDLLTITEYDALDRLIAIETPSVRYEFTYDAWHRRLSKTIIRGQEKKTLFFLYDEKNEIGAYDEHGVMSGLRVLGVGKGAEIGAAIAMELDGVIYVPLHDLFGNVSQLVSIETGNVAETYRYSAFGEEFLSSSPKSSWRYSSKRTDETGLVYFGRRYYLPQHGRWLTPDPQGFKDGPNLYAFVQGNPLKHIDLYGLAAESRFSDSSFWQDNANRGKGLALSAGDFGLKTGAFLATMGFAINTPFRFAYHQSTGEGSLGWSWEDHQRSIGELYDRGMDFLHAALGVDPNNPIVQNWKQGGDVVIGGACLASGVGAVVGIARLGGSAIINSGSKIFHSATRASLGMPSKEVVSDIGKAISKEGLQYTKSNLRFGQQMHKTYKLGVSGLKEYIVLPPERHLFGLN